MRSLHNTNVEESNNCIAKNVWQKFASLLHKIRLKLLTARLWQSGLMLCP